MKKYFEKNYISIFEILSFMMLLFGLKLWVIGNYGNATPYWDQWDAEAANLYQPFLSGGLRFIDLFALHNEHRILMTRVLALGLLMMNGIWNPLLQMVVNAGLHIFTLVLSIVLFTKVIGKKYLTFLLLFSLFLFGIPYAWENTLAGFQSQFYFVMLFSVLSMWFTLTNYPFSISWWKGIIYGILAFFSLASGVFVFGAIAITSFFVFLLGRGKLKIYLFAFILCTGLFLLGLYITPTLVGHESLKATSAYQFINALIDVFSWPFQSNIFYAVIRNLPVLGFIIKICKKSPQLISKKWFLFGLAFWSIGQAASIAYGRAVGDLASRYLDLFAYSILVNSICMLSLINDYVGRKKKIIFCSSILWVTLIIISLFFYLINKVPTELEDKKNTSIAQEINVRNYLSTGDISNLKEKPYLTIPYPTYERLSYILELSSIKEILPTNIRQRIKCKFIDNQKDTGFVSNGYYPTTPQQYGFSLGSYDRNGNETTSKISVSCEGNIKDSLIALPVSGYPINENMSVTLEQNNKVSNLFMVTNPKESWKLGYAWIKRGPFIINLSDSSTSTWLAVGEPFSVGNLDIFIKLLLKFNYIFIAAGLTIVLLLFLNENISNKNK